MNALQTDPGYQKIKEVTQVADESTLRSFLSTICEQRALDQLSQVNNALLSLKAKSDELREVWLDIDDSVLTVFGKQEGAKTGYNPRYHGQPSYKVKVPLFLVLVNWSMPGYTAEMWPAMVSLWSFSKRPWPF